jgi:hypothetical protein
LEPEVPDPPNPDRPQDVMTPFWIGRTVAYHEDPPAFTVNWYGAEKVPVSTAVPFWRTLRFEERFAADRTGRGIASQPKQTVVKVAELSLIAFDFDLMSGTPKRSLKVHTWNLIMEAMGPRIPSMYVETVQPQKKRKAEAEGVRPRNTYGARGGEQALVGVSVDWNIRVDSEYQDPQPAESGMSGPSTASSTRTRVWRDNDGHLSGSGARFVPIGSRTVAAQLENNRSVRVLTDGIRTADDVDANEPPLDTLALDKTRVVHVPVHTSTENLEDGHPVSSAAAGGDGAGVEEVAIKEYGNKVRKYVAAKRRMDEAARAQMNRLRVESVMAKLKQKQEAEAIDRNMTGKRVQTSVDLPEQSSASSMRLASSIYLGGQASQLQDEANDSASEYGFSESDDEMDDEIVNQEEEACKAKDSSDDDGCEGSSDGGSGDDDSVGRSDGGYSEDDSGNKSD